EVETDADDVLEAAVVKRAVGVVGALEVEQVGGAAVDEGLVLHVPLHTGLGPGGPGVIDGVAVEVTDRATDKRPDGAEVKVVVGEDRGAQRVRRLTADIVVTHELPHTGLEVL